MIHGSAEQVLTSRRGQQNYSGKVHLIFTSPPFSLNRQKQYGNYQGDRYIEWLAAFAPIFRKLLKPNGSIVIELGNAWEPGQPVMSTVPLRALLAFLKAGGFYLCQQFICHNPARLPSPAQWVNVERSRVKDSYTHVWWMAPKPRPQADNRRVLKPYSESMKSLIKKGRYNHGPRPSEHQIGTKSFLIEHAGAIPPNVFTFTNTNSSEGYQKYCREHALATHPARMPAELAEFFINFLTRPKNLVLDPFAGSNTTGCVAERLKRRWVAIEPIEDYVNGSKGRFPQLAKRYR